MTSPLKISRILHAGYLFEHDGAQIAFDPIFENPFSYNCYAYPNVEFDIEKIKRLKLDAIFISHYHDDHCSLESLNLLDRKTPIYMYCLFDELFSMLKELGFLYVFPLKINESVQIKSFEIIPRQALDVEVDSIFQIKVNGLNILNVVDSWIDSATLELLSKNGPWDMVLWPFQTMREIEVIAPLRSASSDCTLPAEWVEQLKTLNPKYIVPSSCQFIHESWSWFNQAFFPITYKKFQSEIDILLPQAQVVRLNPGTAIVLDQNSWQRVQPLDWIKPIGEQDVDYHYDAKLKLPTTAEITKFFRKLENQEVEQVLQYCRIGLIEKYKSLDSQADQYFSKPRLWRLSIYDDLGARQDFYYKIQGSNIELTLENEKSLAWQTEVPMTKLFSALFCGESLTSMYMRINDIIFDPDLEKELIEVDIIEDPLIRCLFNGEFGSYQRAQLKRIKERNN